MRRNTFTFCLMLLFGMFSAVPAQDISDKEYKDLLEKISSTRCIQWYLLKAQMNILMNGKR